MGGGLRMCRQEAPNAVYGEAGRSAGRDFRTFTVRFPAWSGHTDHRMDEHMEFRVFGPLRFRSHGRETTVRGRLQRVLLGVLLCRADAVVSVDVLAEAMWGDRGADRAVSNLHIHVHRLRRALPDPERLVSVPGGYRLVVRPGELDAERFETLLDEGTVLRPHSPDLAARVLRDALDLWGGPPFEGVDAPCLADRTHRLAERRLVALQELYTAELARGRHDAVLGELVEQVRQNPLHEHLCALLMVAYHRGGQPGRALSAYHEARRVLLTELGQEPGPELRRVEQQVLANRPIDLAAPGPGHTPPAQLPHDARGFTGRGPELRRLDALRTEQPPVPICVVSGSGGVGKTTLAVRWAHRARRSFPDGQLYVDLHGYGPRTPMPAEDALAAFLRALGVAPGAIPTGLDERAATYRSLVAGRRILVVLDNAHTADQVRPLLPGGATAQVLVTSRSALPGLVAREGACRVALERLPETDAVALLRTLVGARVDEEPAAAAELVERCARLPLALRVVAELVNAGPGASIAALTDELADTQHTLDVLDAGGDETTSVRAVLSWSYRQLPPESARAFRLLGSHPGHDLDVYAVAALTGLDLPGARTVVRSLLRAHLLEEAGPGRYRMHDLLHAYSVDLCRLQDTEADRRAAAVRLFEHYLHTVTKATETAHDRAGIPPERTPARPAVTCDFATADLAARWLDEERANLVRATRYADRIGARREAVDLAAALRRHLSLGGHHDEALAVHRTGLAAARHLGDVTGEATANRCVGSVYRRLGQLDQAMTYMHRSYDCLTRTDQDLELLLQMVQLGVMCIFLGRYTEAFEHLHRARHQSAGLGEQGRAGQVAAHTYLGHLLHLLRRDEEALSHLSHALDLAGWDAPGRRTDAEAVTGWVYGTLGDDRKARRHLELARSLAQDTGNRFIQTWVHPLALVYWRLGMREEAFTCAEECLAVALENEERLVEPSARNTLGELYRHDGRAGDGLAQHRAALAAAETSGIRYCEANAHTGIGDAHKMLGANELAVDHWERAVTLFDRMGVPASEGVRSRLLTR